MAQIKPLLDEYGIIHEANKILPDDLHKIKFLESLAELEDNNAHKTRTFPKTRLGDQYSFMQPIFITGIGTGIGKTLVSAIVTEALEANYWKPVQAGFDAGTDTGWVGERISPPRPGHPQDRLLPEAYKLALPASPHIAARHEGITISLDKILEQFEAIRGVARPLIIEGAGGLLVPLNDTEFVLDLVKRLDATVILVSRNYLGSINHSLLTAAVCRVHGLRVAGWIFNDQYLGYEQEIVQWSGIPALASIPFQENPDAEFVRTQAALIRPTLLAATGLSPR